MDNILNIYKNKKIDVIITSAGIGTRLQSAIEIPKQYFKINGKYLLSYSIEKFSSNKNIDTIWLCVNEKHIHYYNDLHKNLNTEIRKKIIIIKGSTTRRRTVFKALNEINNCNNKPNFIFIHDAARPNFDPNLVDELLFNLKDGDGIIPIIPIHDTVKRLSKNSNMFTENREELFLSQTPQLFDFQQLFVSHELTVEGNTYTDDAQICEHNNSKIYTIEGNIANFKITTIDDMDRFVSFHEEGTHMISRIGIGFDVHRFTEGNKIKLCGVDIPFYRSLLGHSDADVALHSLTDAIYGSIGDGDIGEHFPSTNKKWKNANSEIFLKHALSKLNDKKASISNIDIIIICEEPNLSKHKPVMIKKLSELVDIEINKISVKATTTESLGFTGRKEGIAVQCIISINMPL